MADGGEIRLQEGGAGGGGKTYAWRNDKNPPKIICYTSPKATCIIGKPPQLWETEELTEFHDATLAQATREINAVLKRLWNQKHDSTSGLSFIQFQSRHLLVWTTPGTVGPWDEDQDVFSALRLKRE